MNIRTTLLAAFLGVGLVPAIVLTSLAFIKARQALEDEIQRNMRVEAAAMSADIDKMMFERLQNAAVWSRLDVMQDLQIRDVDKRLSRFLAGLQTGYRDVYISLYCVDPHGNVVGASDAAMLGTRNELPSAWLRTSMSNTNLDLRLGGNDNGVQVTIDAPIDSSFSTGTLGSLRLQLDWTEIYAILDGGNGGRQRIAAVLDGDGRVVAASKALRESGFLLTDAFRSWPDDAGKALERRPMPKVGTEMLVGSARSKGYAQFAGFGWTVVIAEPVAMALAPVSQMAEIFAALLCVIVLGIFAVATWVSREIARPIVGLTGFARDYMSNKVLQAPAASGSGEVGELTDAFVRMVRDIDRSQQNLVRASKLAVVGEMSSVIAHEVRTPLGILKSSAQVLRRESAISAEGRELLGFIETETERLNRLVSAMLDTARPRQPIYVETDLHELLRKGIAMLAPQAAKKQVTVTSRFEAEHAKVECDGEQLTQVILNLLLNALQIVPAKGRVDVRTRDCGPQFELEIADDGPGIEPAERERVFDAFFFKREGGIGLGLAIVQQIVNSQGGEIDVHESEWGGALFRILLPRHRATAP